ncbi:MAG: DUF402 domain-containing protein [Dehalococcoidia bacterium]
MGWHSGETIVIEEVWRGRTWSRRPVTVVEDAPERLVFWCPGGTRWKVPTTPPSREYHPDRAERFARNMEFGDWVLEDWHWRVPCLEFVRPGEWLAVRVTWAPDTGEHWGWYINLQEPFRRVEGGIEMMDMMLDVVVDAERAWWWKDEDEFALIRDRGFISPETAETVRSAGFEGIGRLERLDEPFGDHWLNWRPDPAWPMPQLPEHRS